MYQVVLGNSSAFQNLFRFLVNESDLREDDFVKRIQSQPIAA